MTLKEIQAPKTHIKFTNVIFANGQWIFSGYEEIDYKPYLRIYVSKDLKVFNQLTLSNNYLFDYYTKINYVNGIYIIETEQYIYISTDLIVWKDIKENLRKVDSNFKNVNPILKFLNGQFYLIFYDDSKESIYVSSDLVSWSKKAEFNSQPEVQLESIIPDAFYQSKFYYCQKTSDHLYIKSTSDFYKSNNITNIFVETGIAYTNVYMTNCSKGLLIGIDFLGSQAELNGEPNIYLIENGNVIKKANIPAEIQRIFYANGIYLFKTNMAVYYSTDLESFNILFETESFVEKEFLSLEYSREQECFLFLSRNLYGESDCLEELDVSRELSNYKTTQDVFYIYNLDFEFVGVIDSFKSLRWRRKYFEAGEFEIVVPYDDKTIDYFKSNYLVIRNNYTEAGIIETIKKDDNGTDEDITLSGRFLSSILDRRIVKSTINFKGSSIDGMKALLDPMTPFPNFEIEKTSFNSEQIEFQCTYKNVYDYLIKLSKYSNVGFRVVPNLEYKVFVFENYQGKDRTYNQEENERYTFSDYEYNIDTSTLTTSNTSKVNYALVGGQGEGSSRILVEVNHDNKSGFDLYETFVDKKDSSQDELTLEEYKNSLKQDGENVLVDDIENFEFNVNTDDYKVKYDLGDIVNIAKNRWGYSTIARIIETEEVIEDGTRTVSLVVGTPLPEDLIDD